MSKSPQSLDEQYQAFSNWTRCWELINKYDPNDTQNFHEIHTCIWSMSPEYFEKKNDDDETLYEVIEDIISQYEFTEHYHSLQKLRSTIESKKYVVKLTKQNVYLKALQSHSK